MYKLDSSAIDWIDFHRYPGKNSGILSVCHKGKSWVYYYLDVPEKVYEDFKKTESAGQFFRTEIKDKYNFTKEDL